MRKKENFFVEQYKKCWEFFCESRWYFVFALSVFCFMFLFGFGYPFLFREEIFGFIAELIGMLEGKGSLELIGFIFLNNLKASFVAVVSGILFGILPLVIGVVNGYLLGFVSSEAVMAEGIGVLWLLAPHGIFELSAVIFSIGIGLKIGASIFKGGGSGVEGRGNVGKRLRYNFVEGFRFFVFVVFPLLVVAGIIEGILISL